MNERTERERERKSLVVLVLNYGELEQDLLKLLLKKCKRRRLNLTNKESRNDENIIDRHLRARFRPPPLPPMRPAGGDSALFL
jgi:hypothetical protein